MRKIRKGDEVIVMTGKDRGERGQVIRVLEEQGNGQERIVVEGLNMVKKHTKPNPQMGVEGGIIEKEMPLDISNVQLFNPITKKADRVGFKVLDNGKKVRIFKSNQEVVDV